MSLSNPSITRDLQRNLPAETPASGISPLLEGQDPTSSRVFALGLRPTPQLDGAEGELIAKGGPTAPSRGNPTQEEVQQAFLVVLGKTFEGGRGFRGNEGASRRVSR